MEPALAEPLPLNLDGDDVPWRRGAWMAAGLSGGQPWPEPQPAEPALLRIVPAAVPRDPADGPVSAVGTPADAESPAPRSGSPVAGERADPEQADPEQGGPVEPDVPDGQPGSVEHPVSVEPGPADPGAPADHVPATGSAVPAGSGAHAAPVAAPASTDAAEPVAEEPPVRVERAARAGSGEQVGPVVPAGPAPAGGDPSPGAAPVAAALLGDDWDEPHPEAVPAGAVPEWFAEPVPGAAAEPEREANPPTDLPARRSGRRSRSTPDERAAEQAAADLALLRTFGFADPGFRPDAAPVVEMVRAEDGESSDPAGEAQPVRYRAVRRDGSVVGGAAVTLLDDRGGDVAGSRADAHGEGQVIAPASGSYVLVSTAPGHQPGAVAITVAAAPMKVDVLLARSASVAGTVRGEDGPIAGARVTLVQDGEVVDAVDTDDDGAYRIGDIGAGEYGVSVAAAGCQPVAVLLDVDEEASVGHDVDLAPASPVANADEDPMTGDAMRGQR